jgi:6-phosphogluconate dehydrogenase
MEIGMIGMGKMGRNMALRMLDGGHKIIVFDQIAEAMKPAVKYGAGGVSSVKELVTELSKPRAVWVMVPAGEPTESSINTLEKLLSPDDIVVDGGNSYYKDSMRRASQLASNNIYLLDVGTSGGIWGFEQGYCLMIGGNTGAFKRMEPIFRTLAPAADKGYGWVGTSGAGHFVKMVHNGIEYGLMQAYAEGFELMKAKSDFQLDLYGISEIWRYGSVIRSWLLDLTANALKADPDLSNIKAYVEDSGEGRWTVQESIELAIPISSITHSLQTLFRSRQDQPFGNKLLAAMRNQFGGHAVRKN